MVKLGILVNAFPGHWGSFVSIIGMHVLVSASRYRSFTVGSADTPKVAGRNRCQVAALQTLLLHHMYIVPEFINCLGSCVTFLLANNYRRSELN